MKTSSRIKIYFQQQTDNLLLSLSKPVDSLSENDFHLIRVTLKRIKAILNLLEGTQPNFSHKKTYAPFKVIFQHAGKIRDLQVQLILLRSNPWNPIIDKFERKLTRQASDEKIKLFNLIQPSLILDIQKKVSTIANNLNKIKEKEVNHFLKKQKKIILKLLSSALRKPSYVHKLRKQIKDFYYWQVMLMPEKSRPINTDQFQRLLGDWHDGRVLLQGLKTFMKNENLSSEELFTFESAKRKVSTNNQQLYHSILEEKNKLLKRIT